jgi:site-specific DNA-methyltransferase (adenine-specific)
LRFATTVVASQQRQFRYDLVWSKSVATGFLNARHRPLRAHELILVFARSRTVYHPQMVRGASPIHAARRKGCGENYNEARSAPSRAGATDRFPTSVLEFGCVGTSDRRRRHPQQKPEGLLRWLVRTYSNPRDLVVDPTAGSGSTGDAAEAEGRRFLGWDINPRFGRRTA